jgi:hypothetical protein
MIMFLVVLAKTADPSAAFNPVFVLTPALVIAACIGTMLFKRRARNRANIDQVSWRRASAERAQSGALTDTLVAGAVLSTLALLIEQPAVVPVLTLLVFAATDFWIRYAMLLRKARSTAEQRR